jgi:EAL domain-containing protein (putative c-di-GMP-specific phosphodiesterase class I)
MGAWSACMRFTRTSPRFDLSAHSCEERRSAHLQSCSWRSSAVDTLKIDRSFVARLGDDSENDAVVRTIIALAKSLRLVVTGEGIETAEQAALLHALGCDQGQGYYFARPQAADALVDVLTAAIGVRVA